MTRVVAIAAARERREIRAAVAAALVPVERRLAAIERALGQAPPPAPRKLARRRRRRPER